MPARAMWKAELCVADERVPVKLYSAVEDRSVHFRLLHAKDRAPVEQRMVDPTDEQPVERESARRGVEVERGRFVLLSDDELEQLQPRPSRSIQLERVVPADQVESRWFDRPYYLGPDGNDELYFSFAAALGEQRLAIARWTMRNKRYQGALAARGGYLLLQTLRHTEELVALEGVTSKSTRQIDARERRLAEQLVQTLAGDFDPKEFHDSHREQLLELIRSKSRGKVFHFPRQPRKQGSDSLVDALTRSLSSRRKAAHG